MRFYQPNVSYRMRWLVLAAWGVCAVVYVSWLFEPLTDEYLLLPGWLWPSTYVRLSLHTVFGLFQDPLDGTGLFGVMALDWDWWSFGFDYVYEVYLGVWLAGLAVMTLLFLPREQERESMLPARRRATFPSVAAAACAASVTTISAACLALKCYSWVLSNRSLTVVDLVEWGTSFLSQFYLPLSDWDDVAGPIFGFIEIGVLTGMWIPILLMTWRRRERYWQYERMTAWLMCANALLICVGSLMHDTSSYWDEDRVDTYIALALSSTILLWAWACRIRLLFLLRQYELQPPESTCHACGYDLRGTLAAGRKQCPECGAAILPQLLSPKEQTGNTNRT